MPSTRGNGFLAENADFARACADAGIEFIGPTADMMEKMGDKVKSKLVAQSVGGTYDSRR